MTPQEALEQALLRVLDETGQVGLGDEHAAAILDALPEGVEVHVPGQCVDREQYETDTAMEHGIGAQQERERLRAVIFGPHDDHECSPGFCADLIVDAAETELDPDEADR